MLRLTRRVMETGYTETTAPLLDPTLGEWRSAMAATYPTPLIANPRVEQSDLHNQ